MKHYFWIVLMISLILAPLPVFPSMASDMDGEAVDAVAVVINPRNHLRNLTVEQLGMIFTRRVLYWDALGSHVDYSIRPIVSMNGSRAIEVFKRQVLSGEELHGIEVKKEDMDVLKTVAIDEAAIGLVHLSSARGYKWVRIIDVDGEKASLDNPRYPLLIPR